MNALDAERTKEWKEYRNCAGARPLRARGAFLLALGPARHNPEFLPLARMAECRPPDSAECRAVMSGKRTSVPDRRCLGGPGGPRTAFKPFRLPYPPGNPETARPWRNVSPFLRPYGRLKACVWPSCLGRMPSAREAALPTAATSGSAARTIGTSLKTISHTRPSAAVLRVGPHPA